MFDDENNAAPQQLSGTPIRNTKRQRLEDKKRMLEQALSVTDAALDALNAHPELEQFLNVLETADRY